MPNHENFPPLPSPTGTPMPPTDNPQSTSIHDALVKEAKLILKNPPTSETSRAFNRIYQAALDGHPEAQFLVYQCYKNGNGVEKSADQSLLWLQKAADSNFLSALTRLGIFYLNSVPPHTERAISCFEKSADLGSLNSACILAVTYKEQGDLLNHLKWDKQCALHGDPDSLYAMRVHHQRNTITDADLPEAGAWLSLFEDAFTTKKNSEELASFQLNPQNAHSQSPALAIKRRMSPSQLDQSTQHYEDLVKQRIKWTRLRAEKGSRDDQGDLGWCFRNGYGVTKDWAESARWWQMAAEQGLMSAQNNLGHCYKYAEGVEQNHQEAVRWFQKSADQGDHTAQYNLGHSYCMGLGVPQDYHQASVWIRKSAEAGNRKAQHNLGFFYENGWAVPQNYPQALAWFRYAIARGITQAQEDADKITALMSPEELEQGHQSYQELQEQYPIR